MGTPFTSEKWSFMRDGLLSGLEINLQSNLCITTTLGTF